MAERQPSEYFGAPSWEPVCAIGAHLEERMNAQICVSVFSASIVPEKPRIAIALWKPNLTHDLVLATRTFAVTLLDEHHLDHLEPLGIVSGHDGPKLDGLPVQRSRLGDPIVGGMGFASCRVVDTLDLGDATLIVGAVDEERRLGPSEPITWSEAQKLASEDFLQRYQRKFAKDVSWASRHMRW